MLLMVGGTSHHPKLTLRTSVPLSRARAAANMVDRYFDLLRKVMIEYYLLGKPAQIFNVDEQGGMKQRTC